MVDAQVGVRALDEDCRRLAGVFDAGPVEREAGDAQGLALSTLDADEPVRPLVLARIKGVVSDDGLSDAGAKRAMPLSRILRAGTPAAIVLYSAVPAGTATVSPSCAASMAACTSCCEQLFAVCVAARATIAGMEPMPSSKETRKMPSCEVLFMGPEAPVFF